MRFLFWNTHKNININDILAQIIDENSIDVVILAEYTANVDELTSLLLSYGKKMDTWLTIGCERIHILSSIDIKLKTSTAYQSSYASVHILNKNFILCAVHLPSKLNDGTRRRHRAMTNVIGEIEQLETAFQTEQTIIVGDFNENPYEEGCLSAERFHAVPAYEVAERKERVIAGEAFKMFYNPMWNLFGDNSFPFGTYYYGGSDMVNPFWSILDQVIFRPALYPYFVKDSLKILTQSGTTPLFNKNGHPDKTIASDHFPIMFELQLGG